MTLWSRASASAPASAAPEGGLYPAGGGSAQLRSFLLFGGGINCAVAAAAAVLCMGAPLSSVLVPGLAALRLQRAAAAVGAVVPGWAAIEELGGIDTIELDATTCLPPTA